MKHRAGKAKFDPLVLPRKCSRRCSHKCTRSGLVRVSQKGSPERCRFRFFPFFSVFFRFLPFFPCFLSVFFRFFRLLPLFSFFSLYFRCFPFFFRFLPSFSVSFSEKNGETPFARPLLRNPDLVAFLPGLISPVLFLPQKSRHRVSEPHFCIRKLTGKSALSHEAYEKCLESLGPFFMGQRLSHKVLAKLIRDGETTKRQKFCF